MSMLPSQHLFDVEITVLRRRQIGDEDGTPTWETFEVPWPPRSNSRAYVDYEEDVMTVASTNKIGSVTTIKATLLMEPGAYDVMDEDDMLSFDGRDDWRIDTLNAPRGLWGPRQTQVRCSRQVNV